MKRGENIFAPVVFVGAELGVEIPVGLKEGKNIFAPVVWGGVASLVTAGVGTFCAPESVAGVACSAGFETLPNNDGPSDVAGAVGLGWNTSDVGPEPKEVKGLPWEGALLKTEAPPLVDGMLEPN